MFGFDSGELANRESTAGMALQVFHVGPGTGGRFFQRLHRSVAVFATHNLVALGEGFIEGACSQRPRTFTSHSVMTGDFFFVSIDREMLLSVMNAPLSNCIADAGGNFCRR